MLYDDRLATVLRLVPMGASVARIQLRQLIDLLGTMPAEASGPLVDSAYQRLGELAAKIPATDRARMLGQPGQRLRSPRLMAALCGMEPAVASAAIRSAELGDEQWLDLIPALPLHARGTLRERADLPPRARTLLARLGIAERGLPAPEEPVPEEVIAPQQAEPIIAQPAPLERVAERPTVEPQPPSFLGQPAEAPPPGDSSIGAIVRRIEAFRRARNATPATDAPQLPLDGDVTPFNPIRAFDFTSDTEGRITWAEGGMAPMAVGHLLAHHPALALAVRQHQPFRAITIALEGAQGIAGDWQVDGVPRFDALSGRFVGHMGRLRRPVGNEAQKAPPSGGGDRLRQVLHELRTPVNAIQGFSEIIQQQLFGPTPHEYRALAAVIAADSARMLAGFEELERFARLDSGAMELASGACDMAECLTVALARLAPQARARGLHMALAGAEAIVPVALPALEAERLVWRLLAALSSHAVAGEQLTVSLTQAPEQAGGQITIVMSLPAALAGLGNVGLFHAGTGDGHGSGGAPWAGMFGTGFALRLAAAEARAAGGRLLREKDRLSLLLPGLTRMPLEPSEDHPGDKGQSASSAA
ncbi:sensor histidine kinase [Novosphingobium rosa]|uniref:sensor histidine kinase n=1 Tax=Novosphingobium rosa TaxID=76978 RepID=UPI00082F42BB|nr:histidine kinase dimerization/phospho-acceptor domain-containing protein [Novosphingobium rosa]